jgi:hypothetical protein
MEERGEEEERRGGRGGGGGEERKGDGRMQALEAEMNVCARTRHPERYKDEEASYHLQRPQEDRSSSLQRGRNNESP